jgi:nucleoside-diphosphate-sugar epimerase
MDKRRMAELVIIDLAKMIIQMTGSSSEIVFQPGVEDDPKQRRPDISLARFMLTWAPEKSLSQGLKETIHYFRLQLSN